MRVRDADHETRIRRDAPRRCLDGLQRIRFFPAERVSFLKCGIFSRIRVDCTQQSYAAVEATIR